MAVTVTHAKVSGEPNPVDSSLVGGEDWDDPHVVAGVPDKGVFGVVVDGGGSVITTGVKGRVRMVEAGTITSWTILADQVGSATFDIWTGTISEHIAGTIVAGDSITASAKPTLASARGASSSTLTGWTTSFSAGDVFHINVDSASTVTQVTLEVHFTKA